MAFDIKRAESIASGFKEWIHTGRITYDNAVKQVKKTYREDMAKEIIRILEHELKQVEEKVRWALVFSDVEEAEKARERLSWHHIYPDSQEENKLLWIGKDEAEYAREHVGGLIEEWTPRAPRVYGAPKLGKEEISGGTRRIEEKSKLRREEALEKAIARDKYIVIVEDEYRNVLDWDSGPLLEWAIMMRDKMLAKQPKAVAGHVFEVEPRIKVELTKRKE